MSTSVNDTITAESFYFITLVLIKFQASWLEKKKADLIVVRKCRQVWSMRIYIANCKKKV